MNFPFFTISMLISNFSNYTERLTEKHIYKCLHFSQCESFESTDPALDIKRRMLNVNYTMLLCSKCMSRKMWASTPYPAFTGPCLPPVPATPEVNEISPGNKRGSQGWPGVEPPLTLPPSPLPCDLNSIAESIGATQPPLKQHAIYTS